MLGLVASCDLSHKQQGLIYCANCKIVKEIVSAPFARYDCSTVSCCNEQYNARDAQEDPDSCLFPA